MNHQRDALGRTAKTHGLSKTRTYRIWRTMVARCTVPSHGSYVNYGAKGVTVCDRWRTFENFYADMGEALGLTIDRIENSKGYEPGNCRWTSNQEQQRNKRNNRLIEFGGQCHSVTEWAEKLGINRQTIFTRLRRGLSVGEALEARS